MILVIGYGNPLRSDDAIGQLVAEEMQQRLHHRQVEVYTSYQLVPELASLISGAGLVVFIDARVGGTPGEVAYGAVAPDENNAAMTHHVTPGSLLTAARALYGNAPNGILISIAGAVFDYGSELSPELQQKLPEIAEQVKAIIEASANIQIDEETNYA